MLPIGLTEKLLSGAKSTRACLEKLEPPSHISCSMQRKYDEMGYVDELVNCLCVVEQTMFYLMICPGNMRSPGDLTEATVTSINRWQVRDQSAVLLAGQCSSFLLFLSLFALFYTCTICFISYDIFTIYCIMIRHQKINKIKRIIYWFGGGMEVSRLNIETISIWTRERSGVILIDFICSQQTFKPLYSHPFFSNRYQRCQLTYEIRC